MQLKISNFKTGIEFPVNTLNKIQKIDPLFIEELKKLITAEKMRVYFFWERTDCITTYS